MQAQMTKFVTLLTIVGLFCIPIYFMIVPQYYNKKLLEAIKTNNILLAQNALKNGARANNNISGELPLAHAQTPHMAQLLIEAGARVEDLPTGDQQDVIKALLAQNKK